MEGAGLAYQVLADPALMVFFGAVGIVAGLVAKHVFRKLNGISSSLETNKTELNQQFQEFKDGITKLTEVTSDHEKIMATLASSLDMHEQRIRRCEMDIILVKAEAVRMQDFKRFEQQMEILGGEATAKAVVAFVKSEVKLKEQEVERIKEELQFGRRSND